MLAWLLGFPSTVDAQTVLTGVVHDQEGRIVPGVTVVAVHEATGRRWLTVSSRDGVYQFERLPAGRYQVLVELEAFVRFEAKGIEITGLMRVPLDISLVLAAKESLTVRGQAHDTGFLFGPSERPATFSSQDLATLLLTSGRTLQSIQPLVPGVVFTESTGTLAQFSSMGQRRFSNRLIIDGMSGDLAVDIRSPAIGEAAGGALPATAASGGTQTIIPLESIQEIQVHTAATTPEHARTPGAQTVVVTRAGADRFSGTALAGFRPETLAASDWFSNAGLSPQRENEFWNASASAGGPIRRGRLNYFATWERQSSNRPVTTTIEVPSMDARNAAPPAVRSLFDAFPQPNGRNLADNLAEYTDRFSVGSSLWALSIRADAHVTSRHRVFVRMNRGDSSGDALGTAPYQNPFLTYTNRESTSTSTMTAGWTSILGSSTTSDSKFNISRNSGELRHSVANYGNARELRREVFTPSDPADSWLLVSLFPGPHGLIATGRGNAGAQHQFQFAQNLSMVRGRHEWRFGFEFSRNVAITDAPKERYVYRAGSVAALLQGRPVFVAATSQARAEIVRQSWSAFVQDSVRLTSRLALDYGVRYGVQPAPENRLALRPFLVEFDALPDLRPRPHDGPLWRTSWGRIGPRVGAAYRLSGSDESAIGILRGSWGIVFDSLAGPGAAPCGGYPYVTGRQAAAPQFPALPPDFVLGGVPEPLAPADMSDYYSFPDDLRSPRSQEWLVAFDWNIGTMQRLSLSHVQTSGVDLIYWQGYPTTTARPAVHAYSNDGSSNYRALLIEYVKRLSGGWHARANYVYSRAADTDSGERLDPNPPLSLVPPGLNRGPADFDRPHILSATAGVRIPVAKQLPPRLRVFLADWCVDVVATVRSGGPLSVEAFRVLGLASYGLRVDRVPGVSTWLQDRAAPGGRRLNPDAFSVPSEPRQGTWERNAIRAMPLYQLDLAVRRSFRLSANVRAEVRVETFNLLNRASFGAPEPHRFLPGFGQSFQSQADAMGSGTLTRGGLAPIHQLGGPRSIQIGFRLGM